MTKPGAQLKRDSESSTMKARRTEQVTRDDILNLLSDDEVARVSTAETASRLSDGDEYLDLEQLDQGVRKARGSTAHMGRLVPKKAVHANTWAKILEQLAAPAVPPQRGV